MEKYKIDFTNSDNKGLKRTNSPEGNLRITRTLHVIGNEFGYSEALEKEKEKASIAPYIGRHSDERIIKRAITPLEQNFVRPKSNGDENRNSFTLRSISSRGASRNLSSRGTSRGSTSPSKSFENLDEIYNIPNARLGREVALPNKNILGSSQYTGCQGDFCNFDLQYLVNKEVFDDHYTSSGLTGLSDFRKKLLSTGVGDNYFDKNSNISRLMSGEKLEDTSTSHDINDSLHSSSRVSSAEKLDRTMKINFRSIVQARQEMPLVKIQLERHKRGESGSYLSEENYEDIAVAGKLPGHYYQEVPCCLNCYKVYNIIDKARAKALKKIAKDKAEKDNKHKIFDDDKSISSSKLNNYLAKSLTNFQIEKLQNLGTTTKRYNVNNSVSDIDDDVTIDTHSYEKETMAAAMDAIDGLTKLDVAEIRSMVKPPAAVEVVLEAVMLLLTGKVLPLKEMHRLLSGGEAFLLMLREFDITSVTEERLALIAPYVDNPLFRPENVLPVSHCASKFCAWVHGIVHAIRFSKGLTHKRIDVMKPKSSKDSISTKSTKKNKTAMPAIRSEITPAEELSFVQKLEKMKATKERNVAFPISRQTDTNTNMTKTFPRAASLKSLSRLDDSSLVSTIDNSRSGGLLGRNLSKFDPGPSPLAIDVSSSYDGDASKKMSKREAKAFKASQKKAIDRLSSQSASEGSANLVGGQKFFRCSDGLTKIPYVILGKFSLTVERCSFIVIHDFYDTCDATAILMKPIAQRHEGCQVLCFNYPGQAHSVWPRLSPAEKERGAKEPIINNDWIASKLHELLQHVEREGELLLSCPFHLVGIGNGACIAAAFAQRYGNHKLYVNSLRSLVSINGFLYPDPQLSSILHSSYQVFEKTPHSRPDIPVSYWSRYIFSEEYLGRINPNLALNIYTAVSNPITNEGRAKIAKGALQHRDIRGALAPDYVPVLKDNLLNPNETKPMQLNPIQVPVVILQSTENSLVNASNVDTFLVGRNSKHLWSHMLNIPSEELMAKSNDTNAQWVGKMSSSSSDYHRFSTLGKAGLVMLLDCLRNPRGAFSMWTRTGHIVQQEFKASVLDLLDVLACPTDEYVGLDSIIEGTKKDSWKSSITVEDDDSSSIAKLSAKRPPPKVDVIFKLEPPKVLEKSEDKKDLVPVSAKIEKKEKEEIDTAKLISLSVVKPSYSDGKPIENVTIEEDVIEPEIMKKEEKNEKIIEMFNNNSEVQKLDDDWIDFSKPKKGINKSTNDSSTKEVDKPKETKSKSLFQDFSSNVIKPELPPTVTIVPEKRLLAINSFEETSPEHTDEVIKKIKDGSHVTFESNKKQRSTNEWINAVPDATTALELEAELRLKQKEYMELEAKLKALREAQDVSRLERIEESQVVRRNQYEEEDRKLLDKLKQELDMRQKERDFSEKQRRVQMQEIEKTLVAKGYIPPQQGEEMEENSTILTTKDPILEMQPKRYEDPAELPSILSESQDIVSKLDRMLVDEETARKRGTMTMEDYERVKVKMADRQLERDAKLRSLSQEEMNLLFHDCAIVIGRVGRGYNGRKKFKRFDELRKLRIKQNEMSIIIQKRIRGILGRKRYRHFRNIYLDNIRGYFSATQIQRLFRGYIARRYFYRIKRKAAVMLLQRVFRGFLGRVAVRKEKQRLTLLRKKNFAASKIQSTWRMKVSREEFRGLRIHVLAATEIQRTYRGYLGRKKMTRKRQWESATPGPERIKLGLQFIEESKLAFERQQEEIDALHRAQERAEARVSHIHSELKESEKELIVLERELQEIDQIERDLNILTHERSLLVDGIEDATGMPRIAMKGHKDMIMGKESDKDSDPILERRKKAEAYALEMTIQIKRAEREKKRQELEIEFAAVFQDVEKKKKALNRLEAALTDMESTRERKDREFRRLQKNLTQLLLEQKQELDDLREKGIELETATATTAAAAIATAQKAKEHEKRSTAMFSQTEELMKFQFMSMSLSYFSSLNMLKSLRDMNADTTSAAISLSADAAASASAAAAAANLPNMKKLNLGANDFVTASVQKKKEELAKSEKAEKELKLVSAQSMPENVRTWTVTDVSRWLDAISLGQYCDSFVEAAVDGPFLMELREEDLVQVLNIKHKLHVRKILISREKLKPLNQQEMKMKELVELEDSADALRKNVGIPDIDTVFSQARNGRNKRVEESLNLGFKIDAEDERGNTLLLIAAQNSNRRLAEMLIIRGAKVNHQNASGNTALHFALAFDTEGGLGEYLISHGADDTIENIDGLTCYDGVAA